MINLLPPQRPQWPNYEVVALPTPEKITMETYAKDTERFLAVEIPGKIKEFNERIEEDQKELDSIKARVKEIRQNDTNLQSAGRVFRSIGLFVLFILTPGINALVFAGLAIFSIRTIDIYMDVISTSRPLEEIKLKYRVQDLREKHYNNKIPPPQNPLLTRAVFSYLKDKKIKTFNEVKELYRNTHAGREFQAEYGSEADFAARITKFRKDLHMFSCELS